MQSYSQRFIASFLLTIGFLICSSAIQAQTNSFTYQGKLTDNSGSANGPYQFQFALFDAPINGNQIGSTITNPAVQVSGGVFTVDLDFGAGAFPGQSRYLQISVFSTATNSYVTLTPRQQLSSAPYAIKALNSDTAATALDSAKLGGVNASEYVQTNNPALTDDRNPLPGSANYIQNTTSTQPLSNFNISGEGKANVFTAGSYFGIGANRVLIADASNNTFTGFGAGQANTGSGNSFFGHNTGLANTTGSFNAFFGIDAGLNNNANANVFVGSSAGRLTTTGSDNVYVGADAGRNNTTGNVNAFYGWQSGYSNTTGKFNAFFGGQSGLFTTTGDDNSFFGSFSGAFNTIGTSNSFFGFDAGRLNTEGSGNAFYGAVAGRQNLTGANNAFFGEQAGRLNTTGSFNSFFGPEAGFANNADANAFFGSAAGRQNLNGTQNAFFGADAGRLNTDGSSNSYFGFQSGFSSTTGARNSFFGNLSGTANNIGFNNSFFGEESGKANSSGAFNSFFGASAGFTNTTGNNNVFIGTISGKGHATGDWNTFIGSGAGASQTVGSNNTLVGAASGVFSDNLSYATAIGSGAIVATSNTIVLGRPNGQDTVRLPGLGSAGLTSLCLNGNFEISTCSSSLRYKTNVNTFTGGLDIVNKLKPITFDWKQNGMHDLGLGAEDVAAVNDLLVIHNATGQVEGVKYDRIGVVLLNAVKEQQAQIEDLKKQIEELKKLITTTSTQGGQK